MKAKLLSHAIVLSTSVALLSSASLVRADDVPAVPLTDINKKGDSAPASLHALDTRFIFTATNNGTTRKLYVKDLARRYPTRGIESPTPWEDINFKRYAPKTLKGGVKKEIDDYVLGIDDTNNTKRIAYFHIPGTGIWRTEGTSASTKVLKKTDLSDTDPALMASDLLIVDGEGKFEAGGPGDRKAGKYPIALFFAPAKVGRDGVGKEIWRTDGSSGGTKLFLDANPGAGGSWLGPGFGVTTEGPDNLAFTGTTYGYAPFFNGTAACLLETALFLPPRGSTVPPETFVTPLAGIGPIVLTSDGTATYFAMFTAGVGYDIYAYVQADGSVVQLTTGAALAAFEYYQSKSTVGGENQNYAVFSGRDNGGDIEPWVAFYDAIGGAQSHVIKNINAVGNSNPRDFVRAGEEYFFVADDDSGEALYRTFGLNDVEMILRAPGISQITSVHEYFDSGDVNGSKVFFVANDGGVPTLYQVDNGSDTFNSTTPVKVLTPQGFPIRNPQNLTKLVDNGYRYCVFTCDGTGTEYEFTDAAQTVRRGTEVWYAGSYSAGINSTPVGR